MSKLNVLLKGSAFRSLEAIVAIAIGFFTLPLLNRYLGADLYGLWVMVSSVTVLMYLFDMGFASAVIQKISGYVNTNNKLKVNSIISTALAIYSALGVCIALVTLGVAYFYKPDLQSLISGADFKIIVLLSGVAIAIEFPCKAFAGLVAAHHRFDLISIYNVAFKILSAAALILALFLGYKILAVAVLSFIFSVLSSMAFVYVAYFVFKDMKISLSLVTKESFDELFGFSVWAFLIDINNMVKNRIDIFFIGSFISFAAVSTYYASVRLVDYSVQLLYKMLGITLPTLSAHAAAGDHKRFREDLLLINRVNTYAYVFTFMFLAYAGKSILYYWLGDHFDYQTGYWILVILAFGRISSLAVDGYTTSLYATSKHKLMIYTGFFETVLTALMLFLTLSVFEMGVIFAALSIAIPLVFVRLILLPLLAKKQLELNNYLNLLYMSYRPLGVLVPCGLLIIMTNKILPELTWEKFTVGMSLIAITILFVIFEVQPREKELIAKITKGGIGYIQRVYGRGK